MDLMPINKTGWIPDGRFNSNVGNLAMSLNNPYLAQTGSVRDPSLMNYGNKTIGFTNQDPSWKATMNKVNEPSKPNILG